MKKLKSLVSFLSLVAVMALTIVPAKSVYADTSGGPQGGSNSGTTKPQTTAQDEFLAFLIWLLMLLFGG